MLHCSMENFLIVLFLFFFNTLSPLRHLSVFKFNICSSMVHIHLTDWLFLLHLMFATFSLLFTPMHFPHLGNNFPSV